MRAETDGLDDQASRLRRGDGSWYSRDRPVYRYANRARYRKQRADAGNLN